MKGIEDCIKEIIQRMEEEGINSKNSLLYYDDKWLIETTIMSKEAFAEKYPEEIEGVEEWLRKNPEED